MKVVSFDFNAVIHLFDNVLKRKRFWLCSSCLLVSDGSALDNR